MGWLDTEVDSIEAFDLDAVAICDQERSRPGQVSRVPVQHWRQASIHLTVVGPIEVEGQDDSYYGYYHDGKLDSYDLLNASLQWQAGNIAVTLWGRNLSDEDYAVHGLYFGNDPRDDFGAFAERDLYCSWASRAPMVSTSTTPF